jgi:protein phosphatase methylesterase 1
MGGGGVGIVRACPRLLELKYRVSGVAVLDVVEGAFARPHSLKNIA